MKKIIGLLLAVVLCVSVCACGETQNKNKTVLKTKNISVEKVIADDSYRDDDGSPRRALYVFFNLHPESENIEFDCKLDMKINDTNEYTSEILPGTLCKYVPSYYYGGYLETVYGGYTQKFVATFLVPEGDLSEGKKIIFTDSDINDIDDIILFTDEIIHVNGDMEVGKIADPEGCAKIQEKYESLSEEEMKTVQSMITGRYWEAYVNPTWYKVSFPEPDRFTVTTVLGENGGTYSIRKGYIICTYESNGESIKIPYEVIEGKGVKMDLAETFRSK